MPAVCKSCVKGGEGMRVIRITVALGALMLCAVAASAQNTGSIGGVVKDSSGGVLPGADVFVTNT